MVRNLGGARCVEGQNWGHTDRNIWANRGCRGQFEITYAGDDEGGGPKTRIVTCGTSGTSRVACNPGGIVSSVRLMRELSSARCRTNSTWGHDTREIWTSRGCRAEFEVTYQTVAEPF